MSSTRWSRRVVIVASLLLWTGADRAVIKAQAPAPQLFSDALAAFDVASAAQVIRERFVTPRFDLFEAGVSGPLEDRRDRRLALNLFADTTFTAVLDRVTVESREAFVWIGHLDGVAGSVTLALRGNVLAGEVRTATALYEIRFAGGDAHVIRQVDPASFPADGEPLEPPVDAAAAMRADSVPLADDGSIVDVLVVYTPSARAAAGGTAAIQALIDLSIANTNTSYANSGVIQRVRLVHQAEIAYVETDFTTDLNRLTTTADGFMDSVHTLRNTFGADLVALIINDTGGALCGLAWLMNVNSAAFAPNGFSASHYTCIAGNLTLAHEMGHNMSLNHDTSAPPGPFPFTYGRGYNSGTRRDIMAVSTGVPRMQNFSNPDVAFVGTAEPSGTADRNGALALNNTRMAVANFRQAIAPSTTLQISPAAVVPGQAVTASWSEIPAPTSYDWIALYVPGTPDTEFIDWIYVSCSQTPDAPRASGSCPFTIPAGLPNGTYELRLLSNGGTGIYTRLTVGNSFTVGIGGGAPAISASPSTVAAGAAVTASWSGIAAPTANDWIALHVPGTIDEAFLTWIYVSCTQIPGASAATGSCPLVVPSGLPSGTYELRLFSNGGTGVYTRLAVSNTFTVGIGGGGPTVSASPTNVAPGTAVTVSWNGITAPTANDWMGLYVPGSINEAFFTWVYVSCTTTPAQAAASGSCSIVVPPAIPTGTYEIRLFSNGGTGIYTPLATSNLFAVQ